MGGVTDLSTLTVQCATHHPIIVKPIPDDIWQRAWKYHRRSDPGMYKVESEDSMHRNLVLAYIRHRHTNYEAIMSTLKTAGIDRTEPRAILHDRVRRAVEGSY